MRMCPPLCISLTQPCLAHFCRVSIFVGIYFVSSHVRVRIDFKCQGFLFFFLFLIWSGGRCRMDLLLISEASDSLSGFFRVHGCKPWSNEPMWRDVIYLGHTIILKENNWKLITWRYWAVKVGESNLYTWSYRAVLKFPLNHTKCKSAWPLLIYGSVWEA